MNFVSFESQEKLFYQLETNHVEYQKALMHNGYTQDGNAFHKEFPAQFPYKEKIINNFKRNAQAMLRAEAGLAAMNWQDSLESFAAIARTSGIEWWTTGAILQPLHGMDVQIRDLDFYFHLTDLHAVYEAYQDYIIEPIVSGHRSDTFRFHGLAYAQCTVCFFFEPNPSLDVPEPVHFGPYAAEHLETVHWRGFDIKVPPIDLYIRTLERWGRSEQAGRILCGLQRK